MEEKVGDFLISTIRILRFKKKYPHCVTRTNSQGICLGELGFSISISSTNTKNTPTYRQECFCTPTATLVERSQIEIEQFLANLRFEHRSKLEELPDVLK
jgi:hypothetical protein